MMRRLTAFSPQDVIHVQQGGHREEGSRSFVQARLIKRASDKWESRHLSLQHPSQPQVKKHQMNKCLSKPSSVTSIFFSSAARQISVLYQVSALKSVTTDLLQLQQGSQWQLKVIMQKEFSAMHKCQCVFVCLKPAHHEWESYRIQCAEDNRSWKKAKNAVMQWLLTLPNSTLKKLWTYEPAFPQSPRK